MNLRSCDRVTILDDSSFADFMESRRLLSNISTSGIISHLWTERIFSDMEYWLPSGAIKWSKRRAKRDITPLRNLSLLISVSVSSALTLLIDDDINEFNLEQTRQHIMQLFKKHGSIIAGVHIVGTDERGVIERLDQVLKRLETFEGQLDKNNLKGFFQMPDIPFPQNPEPVHYVSGGYMAYSLPNDSVLAFPPGYNEDWLWCMEIGRRGIAKVFRLQQVLRHDPPFIREMTDEDVYFELLGDLIFDLVEESFKAEAETNTDIHNSTALSLANISHYIPTDDIRVLIERSRSCANSEALRKYGLGPLERLNGIERSTEDWIEEVCAWQIDAEQKKQSFQLAINAADNDIVKLINQGRMIYNG